MALKTDLSISTLISERISYIREDAKLKQSEMAKILETSQSNYSRWETCKEFIPLIKLNMLCNHFHVSMDYIIGAVSNFNDNGTHELNFNLIGKNIKTVRKNNKITQKDLANKLNTTQSTISAYEAGKTLILTSFAIQIVKEYNVSLDWLCGRIKKEKA